MVTCRSRGSTLSRCCMLPTASLGTSANHQAGLKRSSICAPKPTGPIHITCHDHSCLVSCDACGMPKNARLLLKLHRDADL